VASNGRAPWQGSLPAHATRDFGRNPAVVVRGDVSARPIAAGRSVTNRTATLDGRRVGPKLDRVDQNWRSCERRATLAPEVP
jgi:hypothetical protein